MLSLLLVVCILGVIAWGLSRIPMPEPFHTVAYCILVIVLILMLFRVLGVGFPSLP